MKTKIALVLTLCMMLTLVAACTAAPSANTTTSAAGTTAAGTTAAAGTTVAAAPQNRLDKILAAGKIVMGTSPDFAPMEFIDYNKTGQAQYVGADVALGYYIAEHMGVELEVKAMDFTTLLAAISTGSIDIALSGFAYTEERAESVGLTDFYDFESDDTGHGVIMAIGDAQAITSPEQLSGKLLAVQANSLQYNLATAQLPDDVEYQLISNLADAIMMLKTKKVDGVVSAGGTGDLLIKGMESEFAFAGFRFEYESEGNVGAVNKSEPELLAAVNAAIAQAKADNVLAGMYAEAKALAESLGIE